MDDLRAHPLFIALPEPSTVVACCAADLRLYRQDSWQWWECHAGRITTSACAACLGIYEARAAALLGVPPSLRGHGKALDAHARLQTPPLSDFARLHAARDAPQPQRARAAVWRPHPPGAAAAARALLAYAAAPPRPRPTEYRSVGQIRMTWGSVQEATSILAALNHLGVRGATVEEAGLQPLEALEALGSGGSGSSGSSVAPAASAAGAALPEGIPPIGASPDAIVRWADGSVEPLEVKNHAPFRAARDAGAGGGFEVRDPGPFGEVAVWHVPQLYLHMLCLGPRCTSALFMSCSATRGANLFRLRRDEALMGQLLEFVARFARDFGGGGAPPPPPDYYWGEPAYLALLERIRSAGSADVELVDHIPNEAIQRAGAGNERFFL